MTNKPMLSVERDSIALDALKAARQFIANGIELGFISMPEPETPDSAHDTLPMIERAIAELRALLDKEVDGYSHAPKHQGEPVAWQNFDGEGGFDFTEDKETAERWRISNVGFKDWLIPLYAEQTEPVSVALPDRLKTEPFTTIDRGSKNYKAGYNAAIAEVAKLNGLNP